MAMTAATGLARQPRFRTLIRGLAVVLSLVAAADLPARGEEQDTQEMRAKAARLIAAYPDHLDRLDGTTLVWKDGTRMPFDDGVKDKSPEALLETPDIEDQFAYVYPRAGAPIAPPPEHFDPGRIRNEAFFLKMYGDCKRGGVSDKLATIDWLPRKKGGRLRVTTVNGIHEKLKRVSDELDALPATFDTFLIPAAGAYACRAIAATTRRSGHAYGFAVDINTRESDYWLWRKTGARSQDAYRNRIPLEIVRIFETHGFIWGGRWSHFDTMHFEYRPELLDARPAP
jgi:hypothetical protein